MTEAEETLVEIKAHIATLSNDAQIRVQVIASTFRACLQADPVHGPLALALVGAEVASQ